VIGIEWAPLAGALVGAVVGFTGVGGGALMAPILLFGFGMDLATVVATDLLFATGTKLASSAVHSKNKLVDWQISKRLWLGSIPATLVVLALVYFEIAFANPEWLMKVLGALILISALSLVFGNQIQRLQSKYRIETPEEFKRIQAPATTLSGALLGGLVTLTSIGAGALGAMILRALYPLRMKPQQLVATDTTHAIPVSLLAGIGYLSLGFVEIELLLMLLLGSIPAALLTSNMLHKLPAHWIKNALAVALTIAGIKLLAG